MLKLYSPTLPQLLPLAPSLIPWSWQVRSSNDPEVLFGVVFYLLGESFFHRSRGWLILWVTLVVIGILGQFTDGLGSIEGLVYSRVPVPYQLLLLPVVFIQSFLLSVLPFYWIRHPKKWLNWILGAAFLLILIFPALGLLAARLT